jgi:hypothetical protein
VRSQFAVTDTRWSIDSQLMDVRRHVRDGLRIGEKVFARKVLHADIPTPVVPIVDQLLGQNRDVLAGYPRHSAVAGAAALGTMTYGAIAKQLSAVIQIGLAMQRLLQLLPRRGKRECQDW